MTEITRRSFLTAIAAIAAVDILPKEMLAAPIQEQAAKVSEAHEILKAIAARVEEAYDSQVGEIPSKDVWNAITVASILACEPYQQQGKLTDYMVVCDARNNPPEVVDNRNVFTQIYLKFYQNAEMVRMTFCYAESGGLFAHILKGRDLTKMEETDGT